ncbi:protein kinase [Streptomyces sp. NPDC007818]|uniref:methylation-associated defense system protein kinase MAD6 n=1 Tax=Streptomyces sp. NPDC007818 TaxID=3364780 RepID=UPI0036CCB8AE
MAQHIPGGPFANDGERKVVRHLVENSPPHWIVMSNVEVPTREGPYEIDVIVVADHALHLIDVKGVRGRVEVTGPKWVPSGRQPYGSPVAKIRGVARKLKTKLTQSHPELVRVFVDSLVVLPYEADFIDRDGRDAADVAELDGLLAALRDPARVTKPACVRDISSYHTPLVQALTGAVTLPNGPKVFGSWEVTERLGGSPDGRVTDYRAVGTAFREANDTALLRVYRANPLLDEAERKTERHKIANAYSALRRMQGHECVVRHRDFFTGEDESSYVLVLEDVQAQPLQLLLANPRQAPATDTKWRIITDLLSGLTHVHAHKITHRALSPAAVLVRSGGRALLTDFDYARPDGPREISVADQLESVLDEHYVAPEAQGRPSQLTQAADVYAAGVIAYQLVTGELPFATATDQAERGSLLPAAELARAGVDAAVSRLLQRMCDLAPSRRPSAAEALRDLRRALGGGGRGGSGGRGGGGMAPSSDPNAEEPDYRNLEPGFQLTAKYTVVKQLGRGRFGAVYQVFDDLASTYRAVKIITKDPESLVERLRQEYQTLLSLPRHDHVVQVIEANYVDRTRFPYLTFPHLEGHDVAHLVAERSLSPAEVLRLGCEVADGLAFLHNHGVFHCDIKPANLINTDRGCLIIDFNVSVRTDDSLSKSGGTPKYVPPDVDRTRTPTTDELADRDVYALGITLYQLVSGTYPWGRAPQPPIGQPAPDLRGFVGLDDLSESFAQAVRRAISPRRSERYGSAAEFLAALRSVGQARSSTNPSSDHVPVTTPAAASDRNPYLGHLRSLYSQSVHSNAGTRGRDIHHLYVNTALDDHLLRDVLSGELDLVVITGNAGDGKTAFLENLLEEAVKRGAIQGPSRDNGADFQLGDRWFHTNNDGSQDEGERGNDEVLTEFFGPYGGPESSWNPVDSTRLIAINEGRLVDFLTAHRSRFERLAEVLHGGLLGSGVGGQRIAVVNLNRRSVVATQAADGELPGSGSLFDRMLLKLSDPVRWSACGSCTLKDQCYARHNAQTFADPDAGPRVRSRLHQLYALTHLRGRMHITLRDLRSALAYTLTSGRDCSDIHQLYQDGTRQEILDNYYFSSWIGPERGNDRLLAELRQVDVASAPAPALDRRLDYTGPHDGSALAVFAGRGDYDHALLRRTHEELERSAAPTPEQVAEHQWYLATARRRFYFESLDGGRVARMLPYRSAQRFLDVLGAPERLPALLPELITAINRGEGLLEPGAMGADLVLQIRRIAGATIRSYRVFPASHLSLSGSGTPQSPYIEEAADSLTLDYRGPLGHRASLRIRLDTFELLDRLRGGYLPSLAEQQGLHLGLAIFKNALSSAPYQEVLLTTNGREPHRVRRENDGRLVMERTAAPREEELS